MHKKHYANVSQLFSILAYDDEADHAIFLSADKSLGFGFVCHPLSGVDEAIPERINVLLNQDWPNDTLLQISLWTSPDIEPVIANIQTRREEADGQNPLYQNAVNANVAFFRNATQTPLRNAGGNRIRRTQVIVTAKIAIKRYQPTPNDMHRAVELRLATMQALTTIGLNPETINADRYVRIMNTLLNWHPNAGWHDLVVPECDTRQLIREQLFDYDNSLSVDKNGLWLGPKRVKTMSVKRFPERVQFGEAMGYLSDVLSGNRGIQQNLLMTLTLFFPDSEATRTTLEAKRDFITNQASTPVARFAPQIMHRQKDFDVLFDALLDGDRLVKTYLGLVLFCDRAEASQAVSNARTYFRELGFQLLEDSFFCLPLFLNCLPFGADRQVVRDSQRYRTLATRHVIPLLPLFADWPGTGTPALNFISRAGQIMNVSLFDSGSNFNCCIAAQSGSGKSFLTNDIILNYLTEGAMVWVIDVGRSYQNLAETLGGEFIEFTTNNQICLNPFELIQHWEEESDMVAGLVAAMAAPTEKLSDYQTAGLKRVLKTAWETQGKTTDIDYIADKLCQETDDRLIDIGKQLFPFTSNGEYGRFFNGPNNIRFTHDFTCLELEELKGRKHLQQVVLLQLIYQIQQEMYLGERDRPKIVIIDESWDLLSMGDTASFMEHGCRRFRKYGGALIVITQSVNDLYRSQAGQAILENSANMYLLGQKAEAIEGLKKERRLPLSDFGYDLLKTVHTLPGQYSEIFFITERGMGIGRLIVDEFKRLLFSTRAEDVNAIKALRKQGFSLEQAIHQINIQRGHSGTAEEQLHAS